MSLKIRTLAVAVSVLLLLSTCAFSLEKTKIILDTDIGDDIDDAYALALALSSPELEILGVTTAYGATDRRAVLASRMLYEAGRDDIPVVAGVKTGDAGFAQYGWAEWFRHSQVRKQDVVDFYLEQLERYPGQITLVAIGPLTNIGALIERDPDAFRKLKQVVIMGGNMRFTLQELELGTSRDVIAEYNITKDIAAAKKLFGAGVPITMAGLDATQMLKLDETKRERLFRKSSPLTDALTVLYHLWGQTTPTLFDPMAVAMVIDPTMSRTEEMHVQVDDTGVTKSDPSKPANARVCFDPQTERFFALVIQRLRSQSLQRVE
jgi:purine nucleosidase